mmetsp:Transcript_122711/g.291846  ORF Transcript_122711/g.291846 Transcript_122711/m.291846 type:complete len:313 (-) Transcript_122711:111-1049(-)
MLFQAPPADVDEDAQAAEESTREALDELQVPVLHMACAMCIFATGLCILSVVSVGLLAYLAYEYTQYGSDFCEVPLQLWVQVVFFTALFNIVCNQQSRHGTLGARIFCGWSFDPENPERMPSRVQAYNMIVPVFTSVWNILGLYWVNKTKHHGHDDEAAAGASNSTLSTAAPSAEGLARCKEVAPGLVSAIHAYACFNLMYSFFILLGVAGLSQILFWMARRGLLRMSDAAPPGSLERNTEVVSLDHPAVADQQQCSICLEDFGDSQDVLVMTKECGHVFHKEHLANWLGTHRTCPLCRTDLGKEGPAPPSV